MADHIKEVHRGMHNEKEPWEDWLWSLNGSYRKALDRQLSEFSAIRRVKIERKKKYQRNYSIAKKNGSPM